MTPSCKQPVIVDIIIPKGRSFLNRKRHWRKSPVCSEDKPDYKFLVFHPELILSVEFFHIVYDTPNPQTMSGTLCDRNSIREYRHYLHRIFHHEQQMPCLLRQRQFNPSSALRQLLYRTFDRIAQNIISEQGSFSPIVTCVSQGIFCSSKRVL